MRNLLKIGLLSKWQMPLLFFSTSFSLSTYTIIFLRRERAYTKLKYSRTPQFDIVSGGVASLFAAFLGLLACEKAGFELLDGADLFFCFMYTTFASFITRLFYLLLALNLYFASAREV